MKELLLRIWVAGIVLLMIPLLLISLLTVLASGEYSYTEGLSLQAAVGALKAVIKGYI